MKMEEFTRNLHVHVNFCQKVRDSHAWKSSHFTCKFAWIFRASQRDQEISIEYFQSGPNAGPSQTEADSFRQSRTLQLWSFELLQKIL